MYRFVAIVFVVGCAAESSVARAPVEGSLAWHLGESTVSPGSDPSRNPPIAADDPRRMNVSRPLRKLPGAADVIIVEPVVEPPLPPGYEPTPVPPVVDPATSSTPVEVQPDIAPSSTTEVLGEPGVNSPPPPPPGYR